MRVDLILFLLKKHMFYQTGKENIKINRKLTLYHCHYYNKNIIYNILLIVLLSILTIFKQINTTIAFLMLYLYVVMSNFTVILTIIISCQNCNKYSCRFLFILIYCDNIIIITCRFLSS